MPTQFFLIFFITFAIFITTEVSVIDHLSTNASNNHHQECQKTANSLFSSYSEADNNYLKLKSFYRNNLSYVIVTNDTFDIVDISSTVKLGIDGNQYLLPFIYDGLAIDQEIQYSLYDKTITSINGLQFYESPSSEVLTGRITSIIYPNNINSFFIGNEAVDFALSQLKLVEHTKSINTSYKDGNTTLYVFGQQTSDGYLIVILPSLLDSNLKQNLSIFQAVMAACMLIFFIGLTLIMNKVYADPILHIGLVANNIKNLNFDIYCHEYQNKDYRRLSEEINDLNDSLKDIIENLNSKNQEITRYSDEMKKEYQFKKQLVATISHEIKTPLAVMQASIDGILDGIFEGEEANTELQNVIKEINSTNEMLQEIVDLYQLESDTFKLKLEEVNITELLINSCDLFQKIAERYNQQIVFINKPDLIVPGDLKQMTRVINNILLNAITYSPQNSKITIEIKQFKTQNILEVINYGTNIDNADIDKLFEPFYRVDKSRKKSDDHGNGLGLYLVRETLKKHNFEHGISNVINGVKFYIIFPNDNIL